MTKILLITLQYNNFSDAQLFGCFNDGKNLPIQKAVQSKMEPISQYKDINIWILNYYFCLNLFIVY